MICSHGNLLTQQTHPPREITQPASNELQPIRVVANRVQFHLIRFFRPTFGIFANRTEHQPPPGDFGVIPFLHTIGTGTQGTRSTCVALVLDGTMRCSWLWLPKKSSRPQKWCCVIVFCRYDVTGSIRLRVGTESRRTGLPRREYPVERLCPNPRSGIPPGFKGRGNSFPVVSRSAKPPANQCSPAGTKTIRRHRNPVVEPRSGRFELIGSRVRAGRFDLIDSRVRSIVEFRKVRKRIENESDGANIRMCRQNERLRRRPCGTKAHIQDQGPYFVPRRSCTNKVCRDCVVPCGGNQPAQGRCAMP
jgi:hypothetical protein